MCRPSLIPFSPTYLNYQRTHPQTFTITYSPGDTTVDITLESCEVRVMSIHPNTLNNFIFSDIIGHFTPLLLVYVFTPTQPQPISLLPHWEGMNGGIKQYLGLSVVMCYIIVCYISTFRWRREEGR